MSDKPILFGMGNPLLDISAHVPKELVEKYGAVFGNAILAEEKHMPVYEELTKDYKVEFIAGGSTQNTLRVYTWMLQQHNVATFVGSVGKDSYAEQMKKAAKDCGLIVDYHEDENPTGTCAVLVVGAERSLIANLSAANNYKFDHLKTIDTQMKESKFYYSAGYFLTVSPESMLHVAKHAAESDKVFMTNFAATFICQFFLEKLLSVLPYSDYVFANKDEVIAFAQAMKYDTEDVAEVAKKVSLMDKVNTKRERVVVFTQGAEPVIVAVNGKVQQFEVPKMEENSIVDMNGAGDAFCGGFMSQLTQGKDLKTCVDAGNYAAQTILLHSGCTYPEKPEFKN
eukprot:gene8269-94_t